MIQLNEFIKFQSFAAKNSVLGTFKLYASGCKQSDATAYQPGEVKGLNIPVLVIHDTAQVSTHMGSSLEHTVKCSQCKPNSIFPIHKSESNFILDQFNRGAQKKVNETMKSHSYKLYTRHPRRIFKSLHMLVPFQR